MALIAHKKDSLIVLIDSNTVLLYVVNMNAEPYPDLDEDLCDVVNNIEAAFYTPPERLPAQEFREIVEQLSRQTEFVLPKGVEIVDWTCEAGPRPVRVRFYLPRDWTCLTVYMHGGGWTVGSIEGHNQICADLASESGCAVASADYSLSPEMRYPAAFEDCLAVYAAIEDGLAPLSKQPDGLCVGGDSCGANLALAMCLKRRDTGSPLPRAMVLIYPCTEPDFTRPSYRTHAHAPFLSTVLMKVFWQNYLGKEMQGDIYAWPGRTNLAGLPSVIVLTAALDPLVDEGDALAAAMECAGVATRHHRADHLIHGFLRFRTHSARAQAAFSWLATNLKILSS